MEKPRKRAILACNSCRRRKRRCDGNIPLCGLCDEAGVECVYSGAIHGRRQVASSSSQFLRRLDAIEGLLYKNLTPSDFQKAPAPISHPPQVTSPALTGTDHPHGDQLDAIPDGLATGNTPSILNSGSSCQDVFTTDLSSLDIPPMNIPFGHTTTTEDLLRMDIVQDLIGEFPPDLFISTEASREVPPELSFSPREFARDHLPTIEEPETDLLVKAFFNLVHPEIPMIDECDFRKLYRSVLEHGLQDNCDSALCLIVFALGSAVTEHCDAAMPDPVFMVPGSRFLSPALQIVIRESLVSFNLGLALPQALILASKYFGYLLRPLQSWKMIHLASTSIQYIYERSRGNPHSKTFPSILLTAWAAFDVESDLIAEHHLPSSGIENMVDTMPLPSMGDYNSPGTHYWLAELSARRLLNRVHYTMYRNEPSNIPNSDASLGRTWKVSDELNRQLDDWFQLLPATIKPDLQTSVESSPVELNILHRFHSTKDVILRPFLIYTCKISSGAEVPLDLISRSSQCLDNCRAYLEVSMQRLSTPSSCREIILHSTFAAIIVLTLGSLCPSLAHFVDDIETLQSKALNTMGRFAFDGSSIQDLHAITVLLRHRTRVLRRGNVNGPSLLG
ncbi:hypothetical protein BO94DRAFT_581917 [Aspergillus sclerotioniger CBS 115572]|uniref:Zn(2)-C6 fungal-type domain-containing protein n=1 Tax=Aspergillus sclerotioniger CBS 115572 TaxID=1450535 RepID=A0A317X7D5_9EURO|nr:hypothetical protein BO94DRAFT_581917 [Aspergillus sclerotioniger CBS 115572]PWY94526.1 hypothetical protein BO94DRAFT_581917 [Aspergillus sclerotioniger CBS 115572]